MGEMAVPILKLVLAALVACLAFGDDLRDGQVLFAKKDLVFGIVAFDPVTGCSGKCKPEAYRVGVRLWVNSVRRSTQRDRTEVALFTGKGPGNLARDTVLARVLRRSSVRVLEGDFDDSNERVAHREPSRHVHCVMRNRWFVIRDHLRSHAHRYRFVLMTDVRDVLLQGDPFKWRPDELQRTGSERFDLTRTVVLSGEGSGAIRTLRQSKKGRQRTLHCAGDATTEKDREALLDTDPLNAGVTLAGAEAFQNFSSALTTLITRATTVECLAVKDCTDQGLYNLLAYLEWPRLLPHTRRLYLPVERAFSYTLGHKKRCPAVDNEGRLRNDPGELPPVIHQFVKGAVGKALRKSSAFQRRLEALNTDVVDTSMDATTVEDRVNLKDSVTRRPPRTQVSLYFPAPPGVF